MSELVLVANAADATISTFQLTPSGLDRLAVSPVGGKCSAFAIDHQAKLVYAGIGGENPGTATLSLDESSGALTVVRHQPGDAMNYLALSGQTLLGAQYHHGYAMAWQVTDAGLVAGPKRVSYPNAHSIAASQDGRFAYVASLGADLIVVCRLTADGLEVIDEASAPAGSGPRHLIVDPSDAAVYVVTEFSGEALHYRRASDGLLEFVGAVSAIDPSKGLSHSRYGADPRAEHLIWGADLHLSPSGRTLYCSERTESTIAVIPVEASGSLSAATSYTDVEPQPRGFAVASDGRLIVAGERSDTVTLFDANASGALTPAQRVETGRGANWVRTTSSRC